MPIQTLRSALTPAYIKTFLRSSLAVRGVPLAYVTGLPQ